MKVWHVRDMKFIETDKFDQFFIDITSVCKRHGFSISHEDEHGSFEIEKYKGENLNWLFGANDKTDGERGPTYGPIT